jgi:drug/metabolite transporter (DMT)-like permease
MPWASCSENKPMSARLSHSQIAVLVAYLAFALTPALGGLVFAEPMSMRLVIGIVLILGGLLLVAG